MVTRREVLGAFGVAVAWGGSLAGFGHQTKKDRPKLETVTLTISGMT